MAQAKKTAARLVVQGVNVLGGLLGFGCLLAAIGMLLSLPREGAISRWLVVGLSVFMLVVGVRLLRDSWRRFRQRSCEAIKSVARNLAFGVFGGVVYFLGPVEDTSDHGVQAETFVHVAWCVAALVAAWLVYSICTKWTNRVLKAAYGPAEPGGTPDSAENPRSGLHTS